MIRKFVTSALVACVVSVFTLTSDSLLLSSCAPDCMEYKWGYTPSTFENYHVNANFITPEGTTYDPSGMPISPELIDRLTQELETCLIEGLVSSQISQDIAAQASCENNTIELPIKRHSFVVKVANDWVPNCEKTQQLLPVYAGSGGCAAKGEVATDECPCRWRAGIRCENILIVTPSFYLYKDVLIRFLGGCSNPWGSPILAKCASPTTTPMSDGTDSKNGLL